MAQTVAIERLAVGMAVAVAGLVAVQHVADACTCDYPPVFPQWGTSAPLNTRVVAMSEVTAGWTNPRLVRASDQSLVPADVVERDRPGGKERSYILTPSADLEPGTTYQFVVDTFYEVVISEFTTVATRMTEPPAFDGLLGLTIETAREEDVDDGVKNSCFGAQDGWYNRIKASMDAQADDVAYVELQWFAPDAVADIIDWMLPAREMNIDTGYCSVRPPAVEPGSRWCARAVAYDLAGNAAGGESLVCADVVQCERLAYDPQLRWYPTCVVDSGESASAVGCMSGGRMPAAWLVGLFAWLFGIRRMLSS